MAGWLIDLFGRWLSGVSDDWAVWRNGRRFFILCFSSMVGLSDCFVGGGGGVRWLGRQRMSAFDGWGCLPIVRLSHGWGCPMVGWSDGPVDCLTVWWIDR